MVQAATTQVFDDGSTISQDAMGNVVGVTEATDSYSLLPAGVNPTSPAMDQAIQGIGVAFSSALTRWLSPSSGTAPNAAARPPGGDLVPLLLMAGAVYFGFKLLSSN